jgi:hypothetical protein
MARMRFECHFPLKSVWYDHWYYLLGMSSLVLLLRSTCYARFAIHTHSLQPNHLSIVKWPINNYIESRVTMKYVAVRYNKYALHSLLPGYLPLTYSERQTPFDNWYCYYRISEYLLKLVAKVHIYTKVNLVPCTGISSAFVLSHLDLNINTFTSKLTTLHTTPDLFNKPETQNLKPLQTTPNIRNNAVSRHPLHHRLDGRHCSRSAPVWSPCSVLSRLDPIILFLCIIFPFQTARFHQRARFY